MKKFKILFVVLISLLFGLSSKVIKADTIYVQMPGGTQNFCQSSGFDVFVFYKPIGFGSTLWYVGSISQGSGDSLVFLPTSFGTFSISCTWNGNAESCNLNLFSQPPSHPQFEVLGGGHINTTRDTVWMCNNSVTVADNLNSLECTYWQWTGPSFFSNTSPVNLSNPGVYVFESGNPCGVTRDTFVVVKLPNVIPIWHDTSFCNIPVALTLDPGPGWFSHTWSTGDTTATLIVSQSGTYTVQLSNVCISGSSSITVYHENYPTPNLFQYETLPQCADAVITLDPAPGHYYTTYYWSTGETTPSIQVGGPSGAYFVTVTQGTCTAIAYCNLDFYNTPVKPEICVVTVDLTLNKNEIVWTAASEPMNGNPAYSKVASYNIYKATGINTWNLIGNVLATQEHIFVDVNSSPPTQSALYKISMVDTCGAEGPKSYYHKTILLAVTQGANPGEIPLLWSPYTDESGAFQVDKYYIYRGDSPFTLVLYDSVPGYNTSYVDTGVYTQKYYQIAISKIGGCDPSPAFSKGVKSVITGSFSNIIHNIVSGFSSNVSLLSISLYPNPSNGIFHIEGMPVSHVEIMDALGRVVTTYSSSVIDLSAFGGGVYYARIFTPQGSTIKKLIKQ